MGTILNNYYTFTLTIDPIDCSLHPYTLTPPLITTNYNYEISQSNLTVVFSGWTISYVDPLC